MLSVEQVLEILPLSRTTLFRMERDGVFPPSLSTSAGKRDWYADEVWFGKNLCQQTTGYAADALLRRAMSSEKPSEFRPLVRQAKKREHIRNVVKRAKMTF
nr:AlpA family phage regulatory protein [Bradyrhizobium sp. 151]